LRSCFDDLNLISESELAVIKAMKSIVIVNKLEKQHVLFHSIHLYQNTS